MRTLPPGVVAFAPDGVDEGQVAFHIVREKTLVVAEFFLGTKSGLHVLPSPGTEDMAAFAASLEHLRNLPIERVLVAHGPPVLAGGKSAISAALNAFAKERR
jgi:glyoxylase-like metal-dependent hydrolase (beta-lactamase superfamily II)